MLQTSKRKIHNLTRKSFCMPQPGFAWEERARKAAPCSLLGAGQGGKHGETRFLAAEPTRPVARTREQSGSPVPGAPGR